MFQWNGQQQGERREEQIATTPLSRGLNIDRRGFVELALGSVAGATLVGAFAGTANAAESDVLRRPCDQGILSDGAAGGFAGLVLAPDAIADTVQSTFQVEVAQA